jgi:alpha-1,2-mannosyltransferase
VARRPVPVPLIVFVVAIVLRLAVVVRSGGFRGNFGYDPGVYYASADALIHGRAPYSDSFVFLHPPLITLVLSPFAWLGSLTSDHVGFISATVAFILLGALNAALVVVLAERMGLGRRGAAIAGLFYAVWLGTINSEYLVRLEPLGNLFVIVGLLFLVSAAERWPRLALAGAAFGLAASVKVWFVVPLLIVAVWQAIRSRKALPPLAIVAGAAAVAVVVDLPFLIISGGRMWSMVITDQLNRNAHNVTPASRLGDLSTLKRLAPHLSSLALVLLLIPIGAAALWLCVLAWRLPVGRLVVVMTVAQTLFLGLAPSWFFFYTDYVAVPLALTIGAAMVAVPERVRAAAWLPVAYAGVITALVFITGSFEPVQPVPGIDRLSAAVTHERCVMSDAPSGLIELDALDRGLANGCRNWIDVTGRTYGIDAPRRDGQPRRKNQLWQRDLRRYLRAGDAVILVRAAETGIDKATLRAVRRGGALITVGPQSIYRTRAR